MGIPAPHFLLFSEANRNAGDWRFVLQTVDGSELLEVADAEPELHGERLELLAAVRALESLETPSRVTLVTSSRYVNRAINGSLEEWKNNNWQWEWHGEMVPVKHADLWRRVGHATEIHEVRCRMWRVDVTESQPDQPTAIFASVEQSPIFSEDDQEVRIPRLIARRISDRRTSLRRKWLRLTRWLSDKRHAMCITLGNYGTGYVVTPWLDRGSARQ